MPELSTPITPQEAERVWKSQARPSARSVARALTHAWPPGSFHDRGEVAKRGLANDLGVSGRHGS